MVQYTPKHIGESYYKNICIQLYNVHLVGILKIKLLTEKQFLS